MVVAVPCHDTHQSTELNQHMVKLGPTQSSTLFDVLILVDLSLRLLLRLFCLRLSCKLNTSAQLLLSTIGLLQLGARSMVICYFP